MNKNNVEHGHTIADIIWKIKNQDELECIRDDFNRCYKIRKEQLEIREKIYQGLDLDADFVMLNDRIICLEER